MTDKNTTPEKKAAADDQGLSGEAAAARGKEAIAAGRIATGNDKKDKQQQEREEEKDAEAWRNEG